MHLETMGQHGALKYFRHTFICLKYKYTEDPGTRSIFAKGGETFSPVGPQELLKFAAAADGWSVFGG